MHRCKCGRNAKSEGQSFNFNKVLPITESILGIFLGVFIIVLICKSAINHMSGNTRYQLASGSSEISEKMEQHLQDQFDTIIIDDKSLPSSMKKSPYSKRVDADKKYKISWEYVSYNIISFTMYTGNNVEKEKYFYKIMNDYFLFASKKDFDENKELNISTIPIDEISGVEDIASNIYEYHISNQKNQYF